MLHRVGSHDPIIHPLPSCQYRPSCVGDGRGIRFRFERMLPAVLLLALSLALLLPTAILAQTGEATIPVTVAGSTTDSHPYGIIATVDSSLGYVAIAGDVAPFGDPVEDHANFRIAELDLHNFSPKEIKPLLSAYIDECLRAGILRMRIVHGKGKGVNRRQVQSFLAKDPRVESFRLGGQGEGSWGATIVILKSL